MKNYCNLTSRETQVIELLATGKLYKEIAFELSMSEGNVKQRVHHIYRKLEVGNRTEALNMYYDR